MTKIATVAACVTLLWAGSSIGAPTPQQYCDSARIKAWKVYLYCVEAVVAKDAKGAHFSEFAAFAKCRHKYFKKWVSFQATRFSGSTCIGNRYGDNGDQTVTDILTGLVWEKKDSSGGIHGVNNVYSWGNPAGENGTAFSSFLSTLNGGGFAGANGWRVPTLAELQTIVLDFPCIGNEPGPTCSCPTSPCVDSILDAANTHSDFYWSATSFLPVSTAVWGVAFNVGGVTILSKSDSRWIRSVRGGF